ncbi:MAG: 16S rRNA pseudouridine(516) synthase [Clostridia bacterium]|nr:16S rRNA pseudouridine(516) synthase [Clostridia bacterium]
MKKQRLDRFISNQLNLPRTMAKTQIHRGKVKIGETVIRDPSFIFDVEGQDVFYKGQKVFYNEFYYILMDKPKGVLCATEDKNQTTVIDIIPEEMRRNGLAPVGRLDKDTTGLLVITDDGDFAHRCIAPSKKIGKTYIATLDGDLTEEMRQKFKEGIILADKTECKPAELEIIDRNVAKLTITEGKYHQIKRMFGTVGLGVNELRRISIGSFILPDDMKSGECRFLSAEDLAKFEQ